MVRPGLASLALALVLALPAIGHPARGQPSDGAGREVELDEDPLPIDGDDTGAAENPDAPKVGDQTPATPAPSRKGYPTSEVRRPLTLPDFMSETRFDTRLYPSPFDTELGLRARYGITREAQVGVRYAIGGLYDDDGDGPRSTGFNTGKAVAVEFQYLITSWIAPRVSIPMYVDPFAIAMTLGAPVKFRFNDRFALVGFEEVIGFKLTDKFVPSLDSERVNEAQAASLTSGTITSDGFLRFDFGVVYQIAEDLAIGGRFGITFDDFRDDDAPSSLRVHIQYSPINRIDLLGQLGMDALDDTNTLNVAGAVAVRI